MRAAVVGVIPSRPRRQNPTRRLTGMIVPELNFAPVARFVVGQIQHAPAVEFTLNDVRAVVRVDESPIATVGAVVFVDLNLRGIFVVPARNIHHIARPLVDDSVPLAVNALDRKNLSVGIVPLVQLNPRLLRRVAAARHIECIIAALLRQNHVIAFAHINRSRVAVTARFTRRRGEQREHQHHRDTEKCRQ